MTVDKHKLVEIALAEVGTREQGGNNRGTKIVEYQRATWLEPDAWPWCAAFCCWVLKKAGATESERCRDASAFGWEKWGRQHGAQILPETALAKAGDFLIFDFSHIGIVIEDQKPGEKLIQTVEGNTNGKGERDSASGDGVWRKLRYYTLVKCFVRLA